MTTDGLSIGRARRTIPAPLRKQVEACRHLLDEAKATSHDRAKNLPISGLPGIEAVQPVDHKKQVVEQVLQSVRMNLPRSTNDDCSSRSRRQTCSSTAHRSSNPARAAR